MVLCWVMWSSQESCLCFTVHNKGSCFPAREYTCLTYSSKGIHLSHIFLQGNTLVSHIPAREYTCLTYSCKGIHLSRIFQQGNTLVSHIPAREYTCLTYYSKGIHLCHIFCVDEMQRSLLRHLISNACVGLSVSAVKSTT